jgi:predicted AlkP superfamily pyrophosphatase or phosphodiesterase
MRRLLAACAAALATALIASSADSAPRAPVIVVSIDGFRADYFDRGLTPTLAVLAAEGAHAKAMRPSFPSVTVPNHYTLMTGLVPDHHGVVDNNMRDPAIPGWFGNTDKADLDPRWWEEATPLWVTAHRAGLKTATSLWPGDDVVIDGVTPDYAEAAGRRVSPDEQVDHVLGWLDLPAEQRPQLVRLHFSMVDTAGHLFGPDTPQVNKAIVTADGEVKRLVDGLKARGLYEKVELIVLSDHGMAAIAPERTILLDDVIDLSHVQVATFGAEGGVDPLPGHEAEIEAALLKPHDHMTCWRRKDIPAHLHYGSNPRVPAIFCLAEVGWSVIDRADAAHYPKLLGNHGYDPADRTQWAFFVAHGPAFRAGVTLPVFDNVDVYPLLARLLSVKPEHNDGRLRDLATALR